MRNCATCNCRNGKVGAPHICIQLNPQELRAPDGFEDYDDLIVDLCQRARVSETAYLTIDESIVQPNTSQRRGGAHVDGVWDPNACRWGRGGWSLERPCLDRMSAIVAASVAGCVVYPGEFEGEPKEGGDVEHLRDQFGEGELLPANRGFLLSPDCVHESMVFDELTKRTFLRIVYSS